MSSCQMDWQLRPGAHLIYKKYSWYEIPQHLIFDQRLSNDNSTTTADSITLLYHTTFTNTVNMVTKWLLGDVTALQGRQLQYYYLVHLLEYFVYLRVMKPDYGSKCSSNDSTTHHSKISISHKPHSKINILYFRKDKREEWSSNYSNLLTHRL